MDKFNYAGQTSKVSAANGVKGLLLKDTDGGFFFRVMRPDGSFMDYTINHDDLSITIDEDDLASFYVRADGQAFLDHPPQVLGLQPAS
jgi:hypothetical protein